MKKYEDGVYDITNEEYHASAGVSRSQLMLLDKSPYHFWYETMSGEAKKKEPTPAMVIGSAFHTLLLEPEKFTHEYCIKPILQKMPPEVLMKEVGKEQYEQVKSARNIVRERNNTLTEEFNEVSQGKTVLTQDQFYGLRVMVDNIKKHDIVQTLLDDAVFEKSIYWTDEETGLQFKARPDIWSPKMVVDLKSTNDTNIHAFMRSSMNYGYYLQAGMMLEACRALKKPFDVFATLACEKEAPHVPAVFLMNEQALNFGVDQFNTYKRKLKACIDSNQWPAYTIQELGIPKYLTNQEEAQ